MSHHCRFATVAQLFKNTLVALTIWIAALGIAFSSFDDWGVQSQGRDPSFSDVQHLPPSEIVRNNIRCMFVNMSGVVFAGLPTLLNLVFNGFISGLTLRQISMTSLPFSELFYYGRHHAFEFFALWLSGGIGLTGFSFASSYLKNGKRPGKKIIITLGFSTAAVLILTIAAGILETDISIAAFYKRMPSISSFDSLIIIPRESWFAHAVHAESYDRHRDDSLITSVIIHHSGFPGTTSPLRIQEFHMNIRGMEDIAYHYYITTDGTVYAGRPLSVSGEHTSAPDSLHEPNLHSIGICLAGNFETDSSGPTMHQNIALSHVLRYLCYQYHIKRQQIFFHQSFNPAISERSDSIRIAGTVCPGKFAITPLTSLIDTLEGL